MQHSTTLNRILQEVDLTDCPGDIIPKYLAFLRSLVSKENLADIFEAHSKLANTANNLRRLDFLTLLISQFGSDSKSYETIYLMIMDVFLNKLNDFEKNKEGMELFLTSVLDLFWHKDISLRKLDSISQLKLNQFLTFVAKYSYQITDSDDEIFFAINKSMDLIKYQKTFGDSPALIELFLNHFDERVSQRAREYQDKNWL